MAQKRMFDNAIINTDKFMDMPLSSKALYFLLGMEADDYGFVSPRRVMKLHNNTDDDLKILIAKQYVIYFKSGVVVITDWKKNNWLDKRRIKTTEFTEELKMLETFENRYVLKGAKPMLSECLASIEEKSTEEYSIEEYNTAPKKNFSKPTLKDLEEYITEKSLKVDPLQFIDYYESVDWKVGKNKMKDWKATVRNWERRSEQFKKSTYEKKQEDNPDWFGKEIEIKKPSEEKRKQMEDILKEFKN